MKGLTRRATQRPRQTREGRTVTGWKAALGALAMAYPNRLAGHIN